MSFTNSIEFVTSRIYYWNHRGSELGVTLLPEYDLAIANLGSLDIIARVVKPETSQYFKQTAYHFHDTEVKSVYGLVDIAKVSVRKFRKFWILPQIGGASPIIFEMPLDFSLRPAQWYKLTSQYRLLLEDFSLAEINDFVDPRIRRVIEQTQARIIDVAVAAGGRQILRSGVGISTNNLSQDQIEKVAQDQIESVFGIPSYNERLIQSLPQKQLQYTIIVSDFQHDTLPELKHIKTVFWIARLPNPDLFLLTITKYDTRTNQAQILGIQMCTLAQLSARIGVWTKDPKSTKRFLGQLENEQSFMQWTNIEHWQFTQIQFFDLPYVLVFYDQYPALLIPKQNFDVWPWREIVVGDPLQSFRYFIERYNDMMLNNVDCDMIVVGFDEKQV